MIAGMGRIAVVVAWSMALGCGPQSTTSSGGDTGSSGVGTTATTDIATSTTHDGSSSGVGTSSSSSGTSEASSGGEPRMCYPGDSCPPGQCCAQDTPGFFYCVDFGYACNCQTDRDCSDGLVCRSVSIKGEQGCVECGDDSDCAPGYECQWDEHTCVPIPDGSSTSGGGTSGGGSSGGG